MGMAWTLLSNQSAPPDSKMSLHTDMEGEYLAGPDQPQRITHVEPQDQSFLSPVIENVKSTSSTQKDIISMDRRDSLYMGKIGSIWLFGVLSQIYCNFWPKHGFASVKNTGFDSIPAAPVTIFSENALFRQNVIIYSIIMPQCIA